MLESFLKTSVAVDGPVTIPEAQTDVVHVLYPDRGAGDAVITSCFLCVDGRVHY